MRERPSRTAEVVALMRAADMRRDPATRIVDDPYAEWFLGPLMRATLATVRASGRLGDRTEEVAAGLMTYVLARHRFMDDALVVALADGAQQVVVLGAGYDMRAFRFAEEIGERTVFEVDHPATGGRKLTRIEGRELPEVNMVRVPIDFQTESLGEVLLNAGFDAGARTFWCWEGVSMYLTREAVKATLTTIHTLSGPGSEVVMDFWFLLDSPDVSAMAHRLSPHVLNLLSEPITFGIHHEDVEGFLDRLGFDLSDLATASELERRYIGDQRKVYPANYVVRAARR